MKIPCSNCNQRLEIPDELAGQTIECPACNASLAVPSLAQTPSATPQVKVTTPQAATPQKPTPQRKTAAPPKAASSKKSKSLIPKLAVACIASVVILSLFFVLTAKVEAPDISIHDAANDGNIELVKKRLARGVPVNAKIDPHGETALHIAANRRNKEVVELLISEGADVNAKTTVGRFSPLHEVRSKEIAELLIDNGADVNATNDNGDTPLDSAIENKRNEAADLLRKHGGNTAKEELVIAADDGDRNIELVKKLLSQGVPVNAKIDPHGETALHVAANRRNKEVVELLIAEGADVNAKDIVGKTPLHWAAGNEGRQVAELLIANGADVNAQSDDGDWAETPLDWADGETADLLRKHGGKTAKELKAEGKLE